ncbi:hypothetical protein EJD97_011538, partial [Solanum chilense]
VQFRSSRAMNTRRNVARRLEEEIANEGVPPRGNPVPSLEEDVNDDQVPVNPPPLTDGYIMDALIHMAQSITTQAQAITTQAQALMAHANRDTILRANQYVGTMESRLSDFTWMSPPAFYGPRLKKTPESSLMKPTRSFMLWG